MADENTPQGEHKAGDGAENHTAHEAAQIDWKAESRKHEARAKEWAAKAKAGEDAARRLAEIEDAQKSEEQKAQERIAAAEKRAAELELKATRAEVAAATGVPVEHLNGTTVAELEASAKALLEWRGTPADPRLKVASEGKTGQTPASTADAFATFIEDKLSS